MAEIQKILFYTGTSLVGTDDAYGCPAHIKSKKVDKNGKCADTCNRDFEPVYKCTKHPEKYSWEDVCTAQCEKPFTPIKYRCRKHHEIQKDHSGSCGKVCGKQAEVLETREAKPKPSTLVKWITLGIASIVCALMRPRTVIIWGCAEHNQELQEGESCPEECIENLRAYEFRCPDHPEHIATSRGKCKVKCGKKMDAKFYLCRIHPIEKSDSKKKCREKCGMSTQLPLETTLGYRRNVSVFMKNVGMYVDGGTGWDFCVNVACDPTDKKLKKDKKASTLASGKRIFQYYTVEAWNKDTNVDTSLPRKCGKVRFSDKSSVEMKTAALTSNSDKNENIGDKKTLKLDGEDKENCSSRCSTPKLNELQEWLHKAVENQPVFAVCDCNSFHNSAFVFGLLALSRHVKSTWQIDQQNLQLNSGKGNKFNTIADLNSQPVLVLNFDRHTDFGGDKTIVASDSWGRALLQSFQRGVYMAIGVPDFGKIDLSMRKPTESEKEVQDHLPAKEKDPYVFEGISGIYPEEIVERLQKGKQSSLILGQKPKWKEALFGEIEKSCESLAPDHAEKTKWKHDVSTQIERLQIVKTGIGIAKQYVLRDSDINRLRKEMHSRKEWQDVCDTIQAFFKEKNPENLTKQKRIDHGNQLREVLQKFKEPAEQSMKRLEQAYMKAKFADRENWKALFLEIEKFFNANREEKEKPITLKHYYITIDRDCMLHKLNQWGDELVKSEEGKSSYFNDENHIYETIQAIQAALGKDAVLTGMDITGLPESQYLPGKTEEFIPASDTQKLQSFRERDECCVYSECKKAKSPIAGCPNQECKKDEKTLRWTCIGDKWQRNKENSEKEILRHKDCKHKICPYKNCPSANCPEVECKVCRSEIVENLRDEIKFWYEKFDGWISEQDKKKEKV